MERFLCPAWATKMICPSRWLYKTELVHKMDRGLDFGTDKGEMSGTATLVQRGEKGVTLFFCVSRSGFDLHFSLESRLSSHSPVLLEEG